MSGVLILTAMRSELVPGLSALGPGRALSVPEPAEVWRHGPRLLAGYSGMGRGPTERTLRALTSEGLDGVVHMGVAGGLRGELQAGDARLVERAFCGEEQLTWQTPAAWRSALGLATGACLTVDALAGKPHQKQALAEAYAADMVEMETFWAARCAQELSLPFAAVRVVCDTLEDDLPDLSAALDRVGRPRPLKMLGRLARRPAHLRSLPRMASAFGAAQRRLGELIAALAAEMTQV